CMDIADDVIAAERQHGACYRLGQRGEQNAGDEDGPYGAPFRCGVGERGHVPLPRSISTRAERPGTTRPGNGLLVKRIFTGTRCTTRMKFPVALSVGSMANADPLPGAKLSTIPSIVLSG